jgi:hypothetical protein
MKRTSSPAASAASANIDARIASLGDWRGETLARIRALLHRVDPDIVEEWKWMGTPVWSHDGIVCTGESYRTHVKMTFARGAALPDPKKLFNASLDGNVRRAIDVHEGQRLDESALAALFRAAIALNTASKAGAKRNTKRAATTAKRATAEAKPPKSTATATANSAPTKAKVTKAKVAKASVANTKVANTKAKARPKPAKAKATQSATTKPTTRR